MPWRITWARRPGRRVATFHVGGTYLCIEGPQFSTKAESLLYRQWGVDIIGMTNATEAKLAREAEICYATLALVTDFDCWHQSEEPVSVEAILSVMHANVAQAKTLLRDANSTDRGAKSLSMCDRASADHRDGAESRDGLREAALRPLFETSENIEREMTTWVDCW